ncbi:MAG TPA: hypothetical protein VFZ59_20500 [Verrucomicrobiae bacterium]|nr:hypothetical protein [Verrucomicrobiae bacterium]
MQISWKHPFIGAALGIVLPTMLAVAAPLPGGGAPITTPAGGFGIDGDLLANSPLAGIGDWTANTNLAPGSGLGVLNAAGASLDPLRSFRFVDAFNDTGDQIFAGGDKWMDDPNTWNWTTGKPSSKTDINNVLLNIGTDTNGHIWAVIAADRLSTSGESYIDFELLQSPLTLNGNGAFASAGPNGGRTTNDVLLSIGFTSGGKVADFTAWRWQAGGGGFAYSDVTSVLPADKVFVALNSNTVAVPYGAFGQTTYPANAFVEAAIDLTALLGNFDPCVSVGFKTVMVKTKASTSSSASIEDFIQPIQYNLNIGPGANAGPDQVRCQDGAETLFPLQGTASSGMGAVGSTTWSVVDGSATIDDPGALVTTARVTSATATLRLTVTQINGCVKSDDIVLTAQAPVNLVINGTTATCPRTTNTFSAPAGMSSYQWSVTGNASISGPATQASVKVVAGSACGAGFTVTLVASTNVCTASSVVEVAVGDTGVPTLTIPQDLVLDCPAVTTTSATGVATAMDGCSFATVTYSDSETIGCGSTRVIARTWTATDECGNTVSKVQTITVRDITPPTITCPANRTLEYPANTAPTATGFATAVDTCGSANVTFNDVITTNCGNSIVIARTWTAVDECNNRSSCTQTITVNDTTAPVITCPPSVTLECPAITTTNATGAATATDASGSVTITYADTITAECGDTYTISRRWTATDLCGNSSSCTQTIAVRDTTAPILNCPANVTLEYPAVTTTNVTGVATSTDTCSDVTITFVDSVTNSCGNTKTIARRWTASDPCGNSSSGTQLITVHDTTAPVVTIPGNLTLDCPADTAPNATGNATATDASGTPTITYTDSVTASCGNTYTISRRWIATDACGNSTNRTQTITVRDITAPVLTIPQNITLDCPADTSTNNTGVATAVDACGSAVVTFTDSVVNHCGNAKTISRTWRATDQCGNVSTGVQTITVRDLVPPVLTYPPDVIVECGASTAPAATGSATAVDTCSTANVSFSDIVSNACGGTKIISRRWVATDACGNSTNAIQKITVRDTTPPSLVLPANRVIECPGDTRTSATGVATSVDACGSVNLTYSDTVVSNGCGGTFTMQRRWTAVDQCGNSTNGVQIIVVQDKTPPTISASPIKVQCVDDVPPAYPTLAAFLAAGGKASDGCDSDLTFALISDSGLIGSCPGVVTRVYRVTDDCGNSTDLTQTITVDDTIAPTIVCPPDMIVECGTLGDLTNNVRAIDNCDPNVTISFNDVAVQSTYGLNWYAADPAANSAPYLPTYLKLAPGSLPCPTGGRAIDPLRNAVAFGPASGQLDALTSLSGESMHLGQILPFEAVIDVSGGPGPERGTIEFTTSWSTHTTSNDRFGFDTNYMVYCAFVDAGDIGSIDPHANARVESYSSRIVNAGTITEKIEGTFRVSGLDTGDRVIVEVWMVLMSTQPKNVGGTIASDLVSAQKVLDPPQPISVGAKTISISAHKFDSLPAPQQQPPQPPLPPQPPVPPGVIVSVLNRTWTATDDCGNSSTCVQRITVTDSQGPALIIPADVVLEYPALPTTNNTGVATALDCSGPVAITYSDIVSNTCGNAQILWRVWKATDMNGNSNAATQTITVRDTTAPSVRCPADAIVEFGSETSPNALGSASASDFSGGAITITFSDTVVTNCGSAGTINRLWIASDACGNVATAMQTITVQDTTPPVLSGCPNKTVYAGNALVFDAPTASDPCSTPIVSVVSTTTNYPNAEVCAVTRTWTATDACGNVAANQAQTITVLPPLLTKLEIVRLSDTNLLLRWPTNAVGYRLEWSSDLKNWSPVAITPIQTNGQFRVYTSATEPPRFFRLVNTPPTLEIRQLDSGRVELSWPTQPSGFNLEMNNTLSPASWEPVTTAPRVIDAYNRVDLSPIEPRKFFRLKQ